MLVGYARISTHDQTIDLQKDALQKDGCTQVFTDTISGSIKVDPFVKTRKWPELRWILSEQVLCLGPDEQTGTHILHSRSRSKPRTVSGRREPDVAARNCRIESTSLSLAAPRGDWHSRADTLLHI